MLPKISVFSMIYPAFSIFTIAAMFVTVSATTVTAMKQKHGQNEATKHLYASVDTTCGMKTKHQFRSWRKGEVGQTNMDMGVLGLNPYTYA